MNGARGTTSSRARIPGFLFQQNTMRDAVLAGLNLNIFQNHADRVRMANIAQMINVLQAMVLTDKEKMLVTPTYHVFEMYQPFQGATLLPAELMTPEYKHRATSRSRRSASRRRAAPDGTLVLALVNTDPYQAGARRPRRSSGANAETSQRARAHHARHEHAQHLRASRIPCSPLPSAAAGSKGDCVGDSSCRRSPWSSSR